MTSILLGPSADVLDPRPGLRADEARTDQVEFALAEDEPDGIDWDDPESWYDEGGSG